MTIKALLSCTAALGSFCLACTSSAPGSSVEDAVPVDTTAAVNTDADAKYVELAATLQGTWKRISYPYGTLEFRDEEVKQTPGEGVPEPPEFEPYRVSDECPYGFAGDGVPVYPDFMVLDEASVCYSIRVAGDTLITVYRQGGEGVAYLRQ